MSKGKPTPITAEVRSVAKPPSTRRLVRQEKAKALHRTVCPLCRRVEDDPEQRNSVDRVLTTSDNPYIAYSVLHGESPDQLAERFIRKLDESFGRDETDPVKLPGAWGVLHTHGALYRVQAVLVCDCWLDGVSDRAMGEQLGVDHKTVAVMLARARATLLTLLHAAGIRRYALPLGT